MRTPPLGLVTSFGRQLGRQIDRQVCAGSIANAAVSVQSDRERADQRRDAWLAVEQVSGPVVPVQVSVSLPAQGGRLRA
jgi:hypothetical protein